MRTRWIGFGLAIPLLAGALAPQGRAQDTAAAPKVEDLAWMSGTWTCAQWGGQFYEHWMKPTGGVMVGTGQHVADGKSKFVEFMSVEADAEGIAMWMLLGSPSKGPKQGMPFRLVKLSGREATFENPKNEFPTRIIYRFKSESSMLCRLEGTQKGKPAATEFSFERVK